MSNPCLAYSKSVSTWLNVRRIAQYENLLSSNFAATRPLVSSGPSQHLSYSSGRRNVLCLHGTLSLLPYHDVAGMVMHVGRSIIEPAYDASEGLVWGLTLGRGESGLQGEGFGVWAVVDKGQMRQVREKRWDLVSVISSRPINNTKR